MIKIKVPASSANIGPGFDSIGLAIGRYLRLDVTPSDQWEFIHQTELVPDVNHYSNHFIYKIAQDVAKRFKKTLKPAHVVMYSDIPLARGLGSSASAIVAAIELANQLAKLKLSTEDKLKLAIDIEGHPDNVAPCLLGGFIVSASVDGKTHYKKLAAFDTDAIIYIPDFEVKTDEARKVLPKKFQMDKAAKASSFANMMLVSLLEKDYTLAGQMMQADLFHEPYRAKLIPHYDHLKSLAQKNGAYATIISGAGPTMISFVPANRTEEIINKASQAYPNFEVTQVTLDNIGLRTEKKS